jgi:menaquinone-dependent protoporphyrinogen oxidase
MGSTEGVAAAIGRTLADCGVRVEVRPVQEVKSTQRYRAVIVGSAVQRGRWLPEAMLFLLENHADLSSKPFAAFLVCMTMSMRNEQYRASAARWLEPVRALIQPVSEGYFAGSLDIDKVPSLIDRLKFRISVLLGVWTEGDHRDWAAIRAWAAQLQPALEA